MGTHRIFDDFMGRAAADAMRTRCSDFGTYRVYIEGPLEEGLGAGMVRRHDAAMNHMITGGRLARPEDPPAVMARINLFRGVFFEPGKTEIEGVAGLVLLRPQREGRALRGDGGGL